MSKLNILVLDDNSRNLEAAQAQLGEHNLTITDCYVKAQTLVTPQLNEEKQQQIFKDKYGDDFQSSLEGTSQEERSEKVDFFYGEANKGAIEQVSFDVVLCDLLVPAPSQQQGDNSRHLIGLEMPIGIFIALLAAKNGVKNVAVLTDEDHHSHPASACFDAFNQGGGLTKFPVGEGTLLLSNTSNWIGKFDPSNLSVPLEFEEYHDRTDTIRAKNWKSLLDHLMSSDLG